MSEDNGVRDSATTAAELRLDAERLDVYGVALAFHGLAGALALGRGLSPLRDQLDRASTSIVLNIAEGAGRVAPRIERGSSRSHAAAPPNAPLS